MHEVLKHIQTAVASTGSIVMYSYLSVPIEPLDKGGILWSTHMTLPKTHKKQLLIGIKYIT